MAGVTNGCDGRAVAASARRVGVDGHAHCARHDGIQLFASRLVTVTRRTQRVRWYEHKCPQHLLQTHYNTLVG